MVITILCSSSVRRVRGSRASPATLLDRPLGRCDQLFITLYSPQLHCLLEERLCLPIESLIELAFAMMLPEKVDTIMKSVVFLGPASQLLEDRFGFVETLRMVELWECMAVQLLVTLIRWQCRAGEELFPQPFLRGL